jgi:hypothetical protein
MNLGEKVLISREEMFLEFRGIVLGRTAVLRLLPRHLDYVTSNEVRPLSNQSHPDCKANKASVIVNIQRLH